MATFLFWNLAKKNLIESVYRLTQRYNVDVLILAECEENPALILESLNRQKADYHFPFSGREKIRIFTRFSRELLEARNEPPRWTIRQLFLPGLPDILIAAVHLPSKVNWSDASQSAECYDLARMIQEEEQRAGHRRTLVVGDFNMNPFEVGMLAANGLHSESTRQITSKISRVVDEREHHFFTIQCGISLEMKQRGHPEHSIIQVQKWCGFHGICLTKS